MLKVKYRTMTFYSETQKAMMWDQWRQGESLHNIAQLFDRHHTSVRGFWLRAVASVRRKGCAQIGCCRYRNAKRSPMVLSPVARCVPLRLQWVSG